MKTNYRDIIKGKVFSPKNIIWIPVIMISALQLLRIFFEFPSSDECYYFTQPLRFAQGDKPFLDSWDSIQTLGIFLMPFYKLYISLAGTKGIVLFSRFLYFIFAHITAALIYVVLRKDIEHKTAALLSLTVAVYAPFSLYTIGYNQLLDLFGIMGTMIFFIGISCNGRKCSWILCFLAGIIHSAMVASYASSVVIMPILALLICLIGISYAKLHRGGVNGQGLSWDMCQELQLSGFFCFYISLLRLDGRILLYVLSRYVCILTIYMVFKYRKFFTP